MLHCLGLSYLADDTLYLSTAGYVLHCALIAWMREFYIKGNSFYREKADNSFFPSQLHLSEAQHKTVICIDL